LFGDLDAKNSCLEYSPLNFGDIWSFGDLEAKNNLINRIQDLSAYI
jgi:hypothetical protein